MLGHFSGAYLTYSVVYSGAYLTYHTAVDMGGGGDALFTRTLFSYYNFYNNPHCLYFHNPINYQPNDAPTLYMSAQEHQI